MLTAEVTEAELGLQKKRHRWSEVNDTFAKGLKKILLALLQLENRLVSRFSREIGQKSFLDITDKEIEDILNEFYLLILGDYKNPNISSAYKDAIYAVIVSSLYRNYELVKKLNGGEATLLYADPNSPFVKNIFERLNPLVEDKIFKDNFEKIRSLAKESYAKKLNLDQIVSKIRSEVGVGEVYKWNRLMRSESIIAIDDSFKAVSKANGIPYERWVTSLSPCKICAPYSNRLYRLGEGATPVMDTHPNCLCLKVPEIKLRSSETLSER